MSIQIGIVGGTGYTGVELLRLLVQHPEADLRIITSRSEAGLRVADLYPNLRGHLDLRFSMPDPAALAQCDLVFFATPNGIAMQHVPELLASGVRCIDLAADFRIKDLTVWSKWYGLEHACPDSAAQAVYGLPEMQREAIKAARLVANPGCYPTAVQLGFLPLIEQGLVDSSHLIADVKSGTSGAGRSASVATLHAEVSENFKAYKADGHRHLPEIEQGLRSVSKTPVNLTFMPHLLPMIRGIEATLYAKQSADIQDVQALFEARYADEPFVDVLPAGSHPETRSVRGSNMFRIAVHQPQNRDTIVVLSVIDNLIKGAAGQAVHNMNLMLGFPETQGLNQVALLP